MFAPLEHPPGHAQCDFGQAWATIRGQRLRVHYFVLSLPHSDGVFVRAYPGETTEAFCDGHVSAFAFSRDSGTLRGKRTVWGGRARVRAAPYMGALVASRYNPVIQDFYQRLLASGKPKKLALTACMRKLLVILNSMLKHRSPWRDTTPMIAHHSS